MPRLLRRAIASLLFLLCCAPFAAFAKEYRIPDIRVEVEVQNDARVKVTEHRNYVFDGEFSWANYRLPKRGFTAIRDIRVTDGEREYRNENSEQPGTFLVEESSRDINLRWFYKQNNGQRTFTLSYTLEGAIVIGPQWSEFFWNYLAAGREKSTRSLSITLQLPKDVAAQSLYEWKRGATERTTVSKQAGGYSISANNLSRNETVEIRTVFPSEVFDRNLVSPTDPSYSLEAAREDELRFAQERQAKAERFAARFQTGVKLGVVIVVLSIGAFWFLFRKYGIRQQISGPSHPRASLIIPGDLPPAAIGWLLATRKTTSGHLTATLLDLARRGYFRLTEGAPKSGLFTSGKPTFLLKFTGQEPDRQMLAWEKSLLEFFRDVLGGEEKDLRSLFRKNTSALTKWFSQWKKQLRSDLLKRGWLDEQSYTGMYWNLAIQGVLAILGIVALLLAGPVVFLAVICSLVMAAMSVAIVRRTREGETLYHKWKGYQDALTQAKDYQVPKNELDKHFIYAVAFGARKSVIESLFQANSEAISVITWMVILNSSRPPAALAQTFSELGASGTAVFGGAVGASGGASAGASGGGASGGAG